MPKPEEGQEPLGESMFGDEPTEQPVVKEEKKYDDIPEDHPTVVGLKQQIENIKNEYGGNLSGQREVIKRLEERIKTFETNGGGNGGGNTDEEHILYAKEDIKWSKDLTQDQRDEMTEAEIKQMDDIASMKEKQNKLYAAQMKGEGTKAEEKQNDLNGWVRAEAKALAGDDVEIANGIIEATKMLSLEGLDEATVRERVGMAAKLVPNYKAPKEQQHKNGKAPNGGGKQEDPFGVDAIVEGVHKQRSAGGYSL